MDSLTDNGWFFLIAFVAVIVFYVAAIALVLKIFQLVVAKPQESRL